jgi:hypothetical protein
MLKLVKVFFEDFFSENTASFGSKKRFQIFEMGGFRFNNKLKKIKSWPILGF